MEHPDTAQAAAVVGGLGAAVALLGGGRRAVLAGIGILALAEAVLALAMSGTGRLDSFASGTGAVATVAGLGVLCAAAALLARKPALVPLAVLAAAPLRPPIDFDASSRFLLQIADDGRLGRLLPLYFVLAAAVLALAWRLIRGLEPREIPRSVAVPAAAFFAFACLSLVWADDLEAGANLLVFFTLPFAALLAVVARAEFPAWLPRALGLVAVGLASLFAVVGLWQAATHELLFFAPNLAVSNANTEYFRVTSLFGDPSLYGRHLVVLGLAVLLALLALRRVRFWPALALLALCWAGLLFSYSQSSMVALAVITVGIAAATGDSRVRRAVAIAGGVAVIAAVAFVGVRLVSGDSLNQVTSDRTERVETTLRVIGQHPVLGVGIGGQPRASRLLEDSDRPTATFVSHTTPLTVAAELGLIGLALYAWLLLGGARLCLAVYRRERAMGLVLGAALLALFVHALSYSGFLEDPLTWVVLGVGAGFAGGAPAAARPASAQPASEPREPALAS